jgi:predicted transcriptional regulator of viral defense system
MSPTRIQIAKKDVESFFDNSTQKVYKYSELGEIFNGHQVTWRLKTTETLRNFIDYLLKNSNLEKVVLDFPNRKETRYTWGTVSIYQILMEVNPKTYLSHYSAVFFNQLTEQIPKTIFINTEQTPKVFAYISDMEQNNIDLAFRNRQRQTNNITKYKDIKIYHINGKYTDNLGVVEREFPDIGKLRLTNIERTLIDITVRPVYSGGVFEVLKAYKKAKDNVSVNKILSYLKKINYKYPYHQAIGFYLERAGYKSNQLALVELLEREYSFYLDYQMEDLEYDSKWRIYYPKGM